MSVLVVGDNPFQAMVLRQTLIEHEFKVDAVSGEAEALRLGNLAEYKIILLGLPFVDGLTLLRHLRNAGLRVPVVVVSGRQDIAQRVEALQAGADDYVCKPFFVEELLARIRAILRRPYSKLQLADLEVDTISHTVRRGETRIHLCRREFAILELLMRRVGHPVSRSTMLEHIWNGDVLDISVDVHISRLRHKIDQGHKKALIHTVHGGYAALDSAFVLIDGFPLATDFNECNGDDAHPRHSLHRKVPRSGKNRAAA